MRVAEIWRYPVKSLRGVRLDGAELTLDGIPGDRIVHVRAANGRVVTSRTSPGLLGLAGGLDADGEPTVDGLPWCDAATATRVRAAVGADVALVRYSGPERFDVLPLSIATDGAIEALGVDGRRLRPNVVIAGVEGLAERGWPGRLLRIGDAVIDVAKLRARCVMTTFDPDTLEQDVSVLRRIVQSFDGRIALDCAVARPGRIAVGDEVELLP